jgi:hypothetical protein
MSGEEYIQLRMELFRKNNEVERLVTIKISVIHA